MIVVREEADRTDGKFAGGWILSLMQGTALGDSVKYVESWKALEIRERHQLHPYPPLLQGESPERARWPP